MSSVKSNGSSDQGVRGLEFKEDVTCMAKD